MPRAAKPLSASTGARTKKAIATRSKIEADLKGKTDIQCPEYLTESQARVFWDVVEHYVDAGITSAIDSMTLAVFAVALDRLVDIETRINNGELDRFDSKVTATRAKYESTVWKGCNEFCLSPQARAKLGSVMATNKKEAADPLLAALSGD